jgi:hypothetical protein
MQRGSKGEHFSMRWWHLIREIRDLEELIAEVNKPEDVHAVWALHLLQSNLKAKRQMLQEHMKAQ